MRTVRRLLYRDIVVAVGFVTLAFLSLFFFIDFVDELEDVGRKGYTLAHAGVHALLLLPGRFYELFPIAVLIGTIYSMARMAQASEFTILRTGGLGPGRALRLLALLGLFFAVITFLIGDHVAPWSEREAVLLKARASGSVKAGRSGAWLRETRTGDPVHGVTINVAGTSPSGELEGVRIFEFDAQGRLLRRISADRAVIGHDARDVSSWALGSATVTDWRQIEGSTPTAQVVRQKVDSMQWPTALSAGVVGAALLPVTTMTTVDLWRYTTHLASQEQTAQRYEIRFWRKALYPLACLVMMALALPFAYLHARRGGVSFKVFGGIMLGISFVLLNNVAGHLGLLRGWTPWVAAAMPSVLYLMLSMAAFGWLVRYR